MGSSWEPDVRESPCGLYASDARSRSPSCSAWGGVLAIGPKGSSSEGGSGRARCSSSSRSLSWEISSGLCTLTNIGEKLGPAVLRFALAACVPLFCSPSPEGFFLVGAAAEFGVWASVPEIGFIDLIGIVVLLPWLIVVC